MSLFLLSAVWGTGGTAWGVDQADHPDYFFFEESWITVPPVPSSNLQVVDFEKDHWTLTAAQKDQLRKLVARVGKSGTVKEAYIAAYADEVRVGNRDLPKASQKLARQRAKSIRDFLENDFGIDTVAYNMATRPGWWARLWKTEQAKVKGSAGSSSDWVADLLRSNGKASSATVVLTTSQQDRLAE